MFYVCGCFWKHFIFFKERAAASEKILRKKMCSCFLELCPLKKYFWLKSLSKNDGNVFITTHYFYVISVKLL